MNPGYLAYVLMTCFVILIFSGWRIELVGYMNKWLVMAFVGSWFILMPFAWQMTPEITIHLSAILIIAQIILICRTINLRVHGVRLLLISLLISIWHGYMLYNQRWSPTYLIHPLIDVAIGEAMLTAGFIKNPIHQITVISWGVIIGVGMDQVWSDPAHIRIGHAATWDQLFIAIFVTRAAALFVQWSRNKFLT